MFLLLVPDTLRSSFDTLRVNVPLYIKVYSAFPMACIKPRSLPQSSDKHTPMEP
jgi:hypothetical protein